ncbi:MAG: AarF/ABC1/UbiB kinase family protein [Caldilineaceae bacterium]|nr:AarF/ABC1/UbiB kinase family protein [Caldilineaceae bacterium]
MSRWARSSLASRRRCRRIGRLNSSNFRATSPPSPYEQVREIILAEFGRAPEEIYARFDVEPFAAASTAQVHRAQLFSGEEVVVKVQRPDIVNQVRADLGIMNNMAKVAVRRISWAKNVDLVGVLEEFGDNVISELDYRGEAYNSRRLARNMAELKGIHLPTVYGDLSTSKVLTMEFVKGVKITNVKAIEEAGLDRQEIAEISLRSFIKQLLIDGFFHADPHPGNILVSLETGQVILLDTGMVGEIDVNQRISLINLLMVVNQGDVRGIAQTMLTLSKPFRKVDERAYYRDFERYIGRYMEPDSKAGFSEAMNAIFDLLQMHGMRLDSDLTLAVKSLMQAEASARVLHPEAGLGEIGFAITQDLLIDQVTPENVADVIKKQAVFTAREVVQRLPSLQEATTKWLTQYEKGRFEVHLDTSDLSKEVHTLRGLMRMVTIGIVLVGMLIGSAIATNVVVQSGAVGTSLLADLPFYGYVISMIAAAWMVLTLVWRMMRGDKPEE